MLLQLEVEVLSLLLKQTGGEGGTSAEGGDATTEAKPEKPEAKPRITISLKTSVPVLAGAASRSLNAVADTEKATLKEATIRGKGASTPLDRSHVRLVS